MSDNVTIGTQIVKRSSITRERDATNFYPTPKNFLRWLFPTLVELNVYSKKDAESGNLRILDVGYGTGNWGTVWNETYGTRISGVEKYPNRFPEDVQAWGYSRRIHADVRTIKEPFDLIIGNPPYTRGNRKRDEISTNSLVLHLWKRAMENGSKMIFLLPTNYRHGVWRYNHLPLPSIIIDLANRINFQTVTGKGGSYPGEYSVMIWEKGAYPTHYDGYRRMWELPK